MRGCFGEEVKKNGEIIFTRLTVCPLDWEGRYRSEIGALFCRIGKIVQWADFEKSREKVKNSVECRSYEVRSADRNFLRPLILSKSGIEEVYCRLRSWSRAVAPGGFGEAQGVIFMMKIKMYAPGI